MNIGKIDLLCFTYGYQIEIKLGEAPTLIKFFDSKNFELSLKNLIDEYQLDTLIIKHSTLMKNIKDFSYDGVKIIYEK